MEHPDESIMRELIEGGMERGSVCAMIIDHAGEKVKDCGAVTSRPDATAHSEMEVIRKACRMVGSPKLDRCWLYTTHEPCSMCAAAACWSELEGIVYAAIADDAPDSWDKMAWKEKAKDVIERNDADIRLIGSFMRSEARRIGYE